MVFQRTVTDLEAGTKRCPRCDATKLLTEFNVNRNRGGGGYNSWCKPCEKAYHKEREANLTPDQIAHKRAQTATYKRLNPDSAKNADLKRRLGITLDDVRAQTASQNGVCAICKQEPNCGQWKTLAADHDHATMVFRGMLCDKCNKGIGYFDDSPETLRNAIAYLLDPPAPRRGRSKCA